jgi:hypothetical protein
MNINVTFGSFHRIAAAILRDYLNEGVISFIKYQINTSFQVKQRILQGKYF